MLVDLSVTNLTMPNSPWPSVLESMNRSLYSASVPALAV